MIIVVSGRARVGKDTLGKMLQEIMDEDYFIMAYATDLKRRVREDFELSKEQLYGDLKEVPDERYPKKDGSYWTPREILQYMGTEAYRAIDDLFWVKQLFKIIDRNNLENVIITDGRFPDEIDAVKKRNGFHIRVFRDVEEDVHGTNHASETSLDNFLDVDFIVNNNGTFDDLRYTAKKIKERIKEIENG